MGLSSFNKFKIRDLLNSSKGFSRDDIYKNVPKGKFNDYDIVNFLLDEFMENVKKDDSGNYICTIIVLIQVLVIFNSQDKKFANQEFRKRLGIIEEKYNKFLARTKEEAIETVTKSLEELKSFLNAEAEVLPEKVEVLETDGEVLKLTAEINGLREEIQALNKELKKKDNSLSKSNSSLKKHKAQLAELKGKIEELEARVKSLQDILNDSKETETRLLQEKVTLLGDMKDLESQFKRTVEALNAQIAQLKEPNVNLKNKIHELEEQKANDKKAKKYERELIYNITCLLFQKDCSLDELHNSLLEKGFSFSREQIYQYLTKVSEKVNITSLQECFPPVYGIREPIIRKNVEFLVDNKEEVFDILFVSDFHFKLLELSDQSSIDGMYNYCAMNGINLIVNLGDTLSLYLNSEDVAKYGYGKVKEFRESLKIINESFPRNTNIYHAFLGGNHDAQALMFGVDIVEGLGKSREDFISLGYNYANIAFNTVDGIKERLFLHHPFTKLEADQDLGAIKSYLKHFYKHVIHFNRDNSYIDFMGHFHKSELDFDNGFCMVPSLTHDRQINGAWHAKIYFDKTTGKINYIMFLPLVFMDNNKLVHTSEIVYKKKLNK